MPVFLSLWYIISRGIQAGRTGELAAVTSVPPRWYPERVEPTSVPRQAMTVTLTLSPDEERRLTERAALVGQDLPGYLRRLIREDLEAERPAKSQTFAEALAPVHE